MTFYWFSGGSWQFYTLQGINTWFWRRTSSWYDWLSRPLCFCFPLKNLQVEIIKIVYMWKWSFMSQLFLDNHDYYMIQTYENILKYLYQCICTYIFNFVIHVDIQIISNTNLKPIILKVKDKIDVVSIHIYLIEIPCHTMLYLHMYQ